MGYGAYGYVEDHLMESFSPEELNKMGWYRFELYCIEPTKNLTKGKFYYGCFTNGGKVKVEDDNGVDRVFSHKRFIR
jgi:hypothetical protein